MIVVITGATGFIGSSLVQKIRQRDWTVRIIGRNELSGPESSLDTLVNGANIVINLAGAPVSKKWTPAWKEEIRNSRIDTTRKLADAILRVPEKPSLLISSSATGIYNSTEHHTESSQALAQGFLARVCQDWEKEAIRLADSMRVVILRTGVVLGRNGGALEKMERPFSLGLGGKIGSGQQYISFIHIHDLVNAILFSIDTSTISGIVNGVSPYPVTNREFTDKLAKVFGQSAFLTIPAFVIRFMLGEGAQILLEGQKVLPGKLQSAGFKFQFPTIQNCLVDIF
jgi:uncharacterized protein (TIGR01777 family)